MEKILSSNKDALNIAYFNYIGSEENSSNADAIQINEITRHLELLRHKIKKYFRCSSKKIEHSKNPNLCNLLKYKMRINKFLHEPRLLLSNIKYLFSDNEILNQQKIDILIVRYSNFIISPFVLAKLKKIPVVLYADGLGAYEDRTFENQYFHLPYLPEFLETTSIKIADAVIANTEQTKVYFLKRGVSAGKITVVTNGVDPNIFSPNIDGNIIRNALNIREKVTLVGFIGGFHPWHGVEDFIQIFERVQTKNSNLKFLLVGEGPLKKKLEKTVFSRGFGKRIIFTGKIPHSEIPKYIAAMDICIMPNSNSYGSPMKVFEYMAIGKAVIAPKVGPLIDIITDGVDGMLINPGDYHAFSEAILKLAADKGLRYLLGKNAIENITRKHTWRKKAEEISKVCSSLVRSSY